ncbi:MAG: hypothetical protein HRU29_06935 [Rhizobiales bacterium]|nr:hypothetical protein [Hyphomicrobiales bacterium]
MRRNLNEIKMAEPLKFTFDTAFGTRSEDVRLREPVRIISQDDVDAARTQGFIQGRIDGLAEAETQYKAEFKTTLDQMVGQFENLLTGQTQAHNEAMDKAQNFAILIAKKIGQSALEQHPTKTVTKLIADCLSHINNMPHLVVRVNPEVSQLTKDELQPLIEQKGFEGKLMIMGEENIALGDCAIEWADGGVAHNSQAIISQINQLLNQYFGIEINQQAVPEIAVEPQAEPDIAVENSPAQDSPMLTKDEPDEAAVEAAEEIMPQDMSASELMPHPQAAEEKMPQDIETSRNTESNPDLDLEGKTNE